jgi:glycosyltransferase involved in cell wall biosynthesis
VTGILFVDQFSGLGGAQRGMLDLLPALEGDFTVEVAVPGEGPLTAELERRGIPWHSLDLGDYALGRKSAGDMLRYALHQPRTIRRLTELARGKALIFANGPRVFPATAVAARLSGVPLLWYLQLEIESARDRWLLQAAAAIGKPRVLTCSQACLDAFPASHASLVYIGVAPVKIVTRTFNPASPVIGAIGRIHPDKGISDFLAAADEVLCAFPEARFRIAGPRADAVFARAMEEQAAAFGPGCVEFLGEVANPADALAGLDLLVMPSRREAASRVVIEAFSAGVPVVASDAGGLPEVVERNGMMFPRGNSSAMAAAIIRVLIDPSLRLRMVEAGREAYQRRWRVERYRQEMAAQIRAEIEKQTARRRPGR